MTIYLLGSVAGGKTTLARALSAQTGIPAYELDCIVHAKGPEGGYKRTPEAQVAEIRRIDALGPWIIEGTHRKSCGCLLEMADVILLLDTPLWLRRLRILTRYLRQQLGLEACHYQSDLHMLRCMYRWTRDYERDRPALETMLAPHAAKVTRVTRSAVTPGLINLLTKEACP